jgi:hypothetical protein
MCAASVELRGGKAGCAAARKVIGHSVDAVVAAHKRDTRSRGNLSDRYGCFCLDVAHSFSEGYDTCEPKRASISRTRTREMAISR